MCGRVLEGQQPGTACRQACVDMHTPCACTHARKSGAPLPRLPAFLCGPQVLRSRLQQRMDSRALRYNGVLDVVRKTLQVRPAAPCTVDCGHMHVYRCRPADRVLQSLCVLCWLARAPAWQAEAQALLSPDLASRRTCRRHVTTACTYAGIDMSHARPRAYSATHPNMPCCLNCLRSPDTYVRTLFALPWHVCAQREGLGGFYKGLVPNVLRVMPQSALTFLVYESAMRALNQQQQQQEG